MAEHIEPSGPTNDPLREFLESLLGPEAAEEASRAMQAQGFDLSALPGMGSPQAMAQALGQMRFLMNASNDPVNWRMVEEMTRQQAYQSGDPTLSAAQAQEVYQALSVADLWLDPVTELSAQGVRRDAWTRVGWIDHTLPAWKEICDPIAANASRAMSEAMRAQFGPDDFGIPDEMAAMAQSLSTMLPKMAAMAFASQIGSALAAMAQETLGSTDSGLPLTDQPITALLPTNIADFADGLDIPYQEVAQFLAARECAHARLFADVPWLRHDLHLAIVRYAQEITLDEEAITEAARSIDPGNPQSLQEAMGGGIFAAEPTDSQRRAQARLEALLALIEGWVEVVVSHAVAPYLPHSSQLREMMRRRRITGSNADRLLQQLVGLEFRPRQARSAAKIFQMIQEKEGAEARDAVWSHPDRIPTVEQLAHPDLYFEEQAEDPELKNLEAQLSALLEGTLGFDDNVPSDLRGDANPDTPPADTLPSDSDR